MAQKPTEPNQGALAANSEMNGHDIRLVVDPSSCKLLQCTICCNLCKDGVENGQGSLFCLVSTKKNLLFSPLPLTQNQNKNKKGCLQKKDPSASYQIVEFIRRSVVKVIIMCPRQFTLQENAE